MPHVEGATYFHQTGERKWHPVCADALSKMLASITPPEFRSVLGIANDVTGIADMTRDQVAALEYTGPFHGDIDAEDIDEGIAAIKAFLGKLEDVGVNLDCVRLFATGGRGFHAEVPQAVFMDEVQPLAGLPAIYKAMAEALYVDCLDMRIYSARRGRMWRVPNRQRSNGLFKVPVTADEVRNMTAARYTELCSAPREFPKLAPAEYARGMAALFDAAQHKATEGGKAQAQRKAKRRDAPSSVRHKFGGKFPPSVAALARGVFPSPLGWNDVAFQLALLAHECGMSSDDLLAACSGLIEAHQSDSHRYGTPARRREELADKYDYIGRSSYEFSAGGLRSILPRGLPARDLRGL